MGMTEFAPASPPGTDLVPGWLQRLAAIGWRLLAAIVLALVLLEIAVVLSTVTASILVAAIVAATFAPYVLALRDRGWSRIKAAAAVFLGAAFVISATLIVIAIAFIPYITQVLQTLSASLSTLKGILASVDIPPEIGIVIDQAASGLQAWLSGAASGLVSDLASVATVAILATFLTFFFMMDGDKAATFGARRSSPRWTGSRRDCSWSSLAFRSPVHWRSLSSSAGSSRTSAGS